MFQVVPGRAAETRGGRGETSRSDIIRIENRVVDT